MPRVLVQVYQGCTSMPSLVCAPPRQLSPRALCTDSGQSIINYAELNIINVAEQLYTFDLP